MSRCIVLAILLGTVVLSSPPPTVLDTYYESWLHSVEPLMSDAEYEVFLGLDDAGRECFIRRFWEARAPGAELGHHPARERWQRRFEEVRRQFGSLTSDRARAMLVAGKPARVMALEDCRGPLRDLEIWSFSPWQIGARTGRKETGDGFHLVFFLTDEGEGLSYYRQWSHRDPLGALVRERESGEEPRASIAQLVELAGATSCFDLAPGEAATLEAALTGALDETELRERILPPPPDAGWLDELAAELASTSGAEPHHPLAATVELSFPGSFEGATLVRGRIELPLAALRRSAEGFVFDRFVVTGEVWADDGLLVDVFRYVHHLSGSAPGDGVGLDFHRLLAPGTYTFSLRVEDDRGLGWLREVREVAVPEVAPGSGIDAALELTGREVEVMTAYPSVKLLPPGPNLVVGKIEIRAVTTGDAIARVDFLLDGEPAASDRDPPFSAELDLGHTPRRHTVTAIARAADGHELARDEIVLNGGPHRFAIRLVEPAPGSGAQRVQAIVEVPDGERLERVELYLDEALLATLYQPPFLYSMPRPGASRTDYVRAVAYLENGLSVEDTVFLHSPNFSEEIEVRLVELYTSVLDPQGRFVRGLEAERFRVREDGVEQTLTRFDTLENLPIHVALLLDISLSMTSLQEMAAGSALGFFETVLGPRDRAALLSFHEEIRLLVPFTNDLERLRYGLSGLTLKYQTRLWDSVIYAGHYFGGIEGKRVLVLITDSREYGSRFGLKHALEHTLRSGVAVYPIVIGPSDPLCRAQLQRLAQESGGRFFTIDELDELDEVYRRIEEELRSQYLLVYQAPELSERDAFRRIEVEILPAVVAPAHEREPILRAKTIYGYYP